MTCSIPEKETLTVEFKSDKQKLNDRDLLETIVGLANTDGGAVYIGVEDDGTPTGVHPEHKDITSLSAFIANRTSPPVSVRAEIVDVSDIPVLCITVPKMHRLTATSDGVVRRRRIKQDGTPETTPFLPHEFASRQSDLGQLDYTAMPVSGAPIDDLDPLERVRIKRAIEQYGGDSSLLELEDDAFDGALGLTTRSGSQRIPTVLGLLLAGKEAAIRAHIPTHEIAFQVLEYEEVRLNEFWRFPLMKAFELIETHFSAQNRENEMQVGLFRVPVPTVDKRGFREAVCNALTHRDYTRRGAVHIRWEIDGLVISNPGGFMEGVTLANILTTEPRPRNPALADAFKRIGLVERTGRGVDLIYRGLLRYGRELPDYSRSDSNTVAVRLSTAAADLEFLRVIIDEENAMQRLLPIDWLIALSAFRYNRRLVRHELAGFIQKDENAAIHVLEGLVERGLVQPHGTGRGRSYTLSPSIYRALGQHAEYTRQADFDPLQQENMVHSFVRQHGQIKRKDVIELCRISKDQATRILKKLVSEQVLIPHGEKRGTYYTAGLKI